MTAYLKKGMFLTTKAGDKVNSMVIGWGHISNYVIEAEKNLSAYDYAASAMQRWYLSLPRYSKESKGIGDKESSKR